MKDENISRKLEKYKAMVLLGHDSTRSKIKINDKMLRTCVKL